MIIELIRAHTADEVGCEEACAICAQRFRTEAVLVTASAEEGTILGPVCPACLDALGAYRPDKFPTLDEFETAKLRFPGPIWEDLEAASDTLEQGAPHRVALEASRIGRTGAPSAA